MKIAAEVFGVEQSVDFETMETTQHLILGVFGETVRVPISDAQMEAITVEAVRQKTGIASPEETFAETREGLDGQPPSQGAPAEPAEERRFSVMTGLSDPSGGGGEGEEEADPGVGGFFGESDEAKEEKLRARTPQRRTVPRDSAGNPDVPQHSGIGLPQMPMPSGVADDDFPQG